LTKTAFKRFFLRKCLKQSMISIIIHNLLHKLLSLSLYRPYCFNVIFFFQSVELLYHEQILTILDSFSVKICSNLDVFNFRMPSMVMQRIGQEEFLLSLFQMNLELWIHIINLYNNGINFSQFVAWWQFLWIHYFYSCSLWIRYGFFSLLYIQILQFTVLSICNLLNFFLFLFAGT
jgi:hypothetical protein